MNAGIYRLVYNATRGLWMVVSEHATSHQSSGNSLTRREIRVAKRRQQNALKKERSPFHLLLIGVALSGLVNVSWAGTLSPNTVPTGLQVTQGKVVINAPVINPANVAGQLVNINQSSLKGIVQGTNFSIGSASVVNFNHTGGANAATLIRINGQKSVIEGTLNSPNGKLYLINPDGILFGDGARVNVNGLVASALNMNNSDFLSDLGDFNAYQDGKRAAFVWDGTEDQYKIAVVQIEPDAQIKAALGSSVMLFAPKVLNQGSIETTEGQVAMAAGEKVYLSIAPELKDTLTGYGYVYSKDSPYRSLEGVLIEVDSHSVGQTDSNGKTTEIKGEVTNDTMGRILAQRGNITLAGFTVNQNGRVTATSSVNQKGSIRLLARDTISVLDLNTKGITEPTIALTVDGKLPNGNTPLEYGGLILDNVTNTTNDIIVGSRTGELNLGKNSITAVLAEHVSSLSRAQELFNVASIVGEPLPQKGEQTYAQKVLSAVNNESGTVTDDQIFSLPTLEAIGRKVVINDGAKLVVPGGSIDISAQKNGTAFNVGNNNLFDKESKLYIGKNTLIDVSGLENVSVNMERNFIEQLLTQTDLKDNAVNKDGFLNRQKVWYDIRNLPDSKVADLAGYLSSVPRSLGEKLTSGGSIKLQSEGDLIQRAGSTIDVSAGSLLYKSGLNKESWLVTANGTSYSLSDAPVDTIFTGFLGGSSSLLHQEAGYTEGKSAGSLSIKSVNLAIDGQLLGNGLYGEKQRVGNLLGGHLTIDLLKSPELDSHQLTIGQNQLLDATFDEKSTLTTNRINTVQIDANTLNNSGFGTILFSRSGVQEGQNTINAELNLTDGTQLVFLDGASGAVNKNVTIRSGLLSMNQSVDVANNVKIDLSGNWVNDKLSLLNNHIMVNGGSISLAINSIGENTSFNVSSGGWLKTNNSIKNGDAGSILLSNVNQSIITNTQLLGYGLGKGGSLSLSANYITIGQNGYGQQNELVLSDDFFQEGGFSNYVFTGLNNVIVRSDATVNVQTKNLLLNQNYVTKTTGSHISDFSKTTLLPEYLREAINLTLATTNAPSSNEVSHTSTGSLIVETGAHIKVGANQTDQNSSINLSAWKNQLFVDGTLTALGGTINLTMQGNPLEKDLDTFYNPAQAIWLGANSRLLVGGYTSYFPNVNGLRQGIVHDGGAININAQMGYVVAEKNAVLDISGSKATLDIKTPNTITPNTITSNAGLISFSAREGMVLNPTIKSDTYGGLGGNLSLTLSRGDTVYSGISSYPGTTPDVNVNRDGYKPDQQWVTEISQTSSDLPIGFKVGDSIESIAPGLTLISADTINAPKLADIAINTEHAIQFLGDVDLYSTRSIAMDTQVIKANPGSTINLIAPHITLSNSDVSLRQKENLSLTTTNTGDANLNLNASLIDVNGQVTLSGFDNTNFKSQNDIRLSGRSDLQIGALVSTGALTFSMRQLYPTTYSNFTISSGGEGGSVTFNKLNANDSFTNVLSASGLLSVNAETINQNGVLLAPFGKISLNATNELNVNSGSVTSVSANGLLIPFGYTQRAGLDYVYNAYGNTNAISTLPESIIVLNAPNINENSGSVLDLTGGGDLFAYEWIKGLGGSTDVLANTASQKAFGANVSNTWSIVPSNNQTYASFDTQYWQGSDLVMGDAVYLTGVKGLADGYYSLMPARYALLPGAMLVSAVTNYQDRVSGLNQTLESGASLVSGHLASYTSDGYIQSSRTGGFIVRAGSDANKLAQYNTTTAGNFFQSYSNSKQVNDAGRVTIAASSSLKLQGAINALPYLNGNGAEMDVAAPNILIVAKDQLVGKVNIEGVEFLAIDDATLQNYNLGSLLLGGTRENGQLSVVSDNVRMENGATLSGSEILLVANQTVQLDSGSKLSGIGLNSANRDLTIGSIEKGLSGDGALIKVSGGGLTSVTRENVSSSQGDLVMSTGSSIYSFGSILLDASKGYKLKGDITFAEGTAIGLSSNHISLGSPENGEQVKDGLWLTNSQLSAFVNAGSLQLNSRSTVDIYGDLSFGNDLLNLEVNSAGIAGYQNSGNAATIYANNVTLNNKNQNTFSLANALSHNTIPVLGTGILNVEAKNIVLGANQVAIKGFDQTNLTAKNEMIAKFQNDSSSTATGELDVDGNLTLATNHLTTDANVQYAINAGVNIVKEGLLTVKGVDASPYTTANQHASQASSLMLSGNQLDLKGNDVTTGQVASTIEVKGGIIKLVANGELSANGLTIGNGATLNVQGVTYTIHDQEVDISAGKIDLSSTSGNIDIEQGANLNLSAANGGDAGQFKASALNGTVTLNSEIKATETDQAGKNATAILEAKTMDFNANSQALKSFSGSQSYRVIEGDVVVNNDTSIKSQSINIEVDNGSITVNGLINASADKGGVIGLYANNNIDVTSNALLVAQGLGDKKSDAGTFGDGGSVILSSKSGIINVASSSSNTSGNDAIIDVSGDKQGAINGTGGIVTFRVDGSKVSNINSQSTASILGADEVYITPISLFEKTTINQTQLDTINTSLDDLTTQFGVEHFRQTIDNKNVSILPEAVVHSNSDLTVSGNLKLNTSPSVLSLSADNDLKINGTIDGLNTNGSSLRLIAGADVTSANVEKVNNGVGDIVFKNATYVRTDSGFIHVQAGHNLDLASTGSSGASIYTKGIDTSDPDGFARLSAQAKEYYGSLGGNVTINTGADILGSETASKSQSVNNWLTQAVNGDNLNSQARWYVQDVKPTSAAFSKAKGFLNGIGTLGGGDVTISTAGNITNVQIASATNGRMGGDANTTPNLANFVELGGGDINISALGNVRNTLIQSGKGALNVRAGGNISTSLSLMNTQTVLTANQTIDIAELNNPTNNTSNLNSNAFRTTFYTYADNTSLHAISYAGDTLIGNVSLDITSERKLLPSIVYAAALNGSVNLINDVMYPSSNGSLTLLAEKNINVQKVAMSDVDPSRLNTPFSTNLKSSTSTDLNITIGALGHSEHFLYSNTSEPVRLYANNDVIFSPKLGDEFTANKQIQVIANNDIVDANIKVQNNFANDVSIIQAGNDVRYSTPTLMSDGRYESVPGGIQVSGPGRLHVIAGKDIDLGFGSGIRSIGAVNNPYLPELGADIMAQAGASGKTDFDSMITNYLEIGSYSNLYLSELVTYMQAKLGDDSLTQQSALIAFKGLSNAQQAAFMNKIFFNELKVSGRDAIDTKSEYFGDYSRAEKAILTMFPEFAQSETIQTLLAKNGSIMDAFGNIKSETLTHTGNISLFNSQIKSERGGTIEMLVPQGYVNAGLEVNGGVAKPDSDLGIVSLRGGELSGMVRTDFQVNQSRVFTLGGSDLLLYSALANIDAGKGSKTASSTPPPVLRIVNGQLVFDYSGAVTGSGIASLTSTGGMPGTVDLFAPYGEINAGEAGIRSAGNINLGALLIVGADNITAGGTTSGVPAVSSSGLSMTPASTSNPGAGSQGDKLADASKDAISNKLVSMPSMISVEVLSLGDESSDGNSSNKAPCKDSTKKSKECLD
jgi:filamentous hemagglutinin